MIWARELRSGFVSVPGGAGASREREASHGPRAADGPPRRGTGAGPPPSFPLPLPNCVLARLVDHKK